MKKGSNYDLFKQDALKRFMDYDQEQMIRRLNLTADETFIYVVSCKTLFRFSRQEPKLEKSEMILGGEIDPETYKGPWMETDANEVLTLCDYLCHTTAPVTLSGEFMTLKSLNRVKGGSTQTMLGSSMFRNVSLALDGKDRELIEACELLGGVPAGKGDVAYELPFLGDIRVRFSFYNSDEDFEAMLNLLYPANICEYLHYETLYYGVMVLMDRLKDLCGIE